MTSVSDAFPVQYCCPGNSDAVDKVISYIENKNTGSLGKTISVLWLMMVAIRRWIYDLSIWSLLTQLAGYVET